MRRKQAAGGKQTPTERITSPSVPLSGVLAEFRNALSAEVEAAKRASASGAIPLSNGRPLGTLGGGFQYQFDVESALDLPGDAPGELRIPGADPIRVSVVAFEGLAVILNSEKDLGRFVPMARLQSNLAMLLLKLIDRIENKSLLPNPAGSRLLGTTQPLGASERVTAEQLESHGLALNVEQREAVGSVLGRDTTYIWGPPGTGKTHTIGAIGAELFRRGQSLLVVSHTNSAVDGAILQIGAAVRRAAPEEVGIGLVIRVGTPRDARLRSAENESLLLSVQRERRQAQLAARKATLAAERDPLLVRERELTLLIELHEWLADAEPDMQRLADELASLSRLRESSRSLGEEERQVELALRDVRSHDKGLEAAVWAVDHEDECRTRCAESRAERDACQEKLDAAHRRTTSLQTDLARSEDIEPKRAQLSKHPPLAGARETLEVSKRKEAQDRAALARAEQELLAAELLLTETESVNWITRKWKGLPEPDAQRRLVQDGQQAVARARATWSDSAEQRQRVEDLVRVIERLTDDLSPYVGIPRVPDIRRRLDDEQRALYRLRLQHSKADKAFVAADSELRAIEEVLATFRARHKCEPRELSERGQALEDQLKSVRASKRERLREEQSVTNNITAELRRGLSLLRDLGLAGEPPETPEDMYAALSAGVAHARRRADALPKEAAETERRRTIDRLKAIASEAETIEEVLKRVEETVIREARIVGATLTSSYLRDAIQSRRFDTVLLDEASMAAIPALWTAASLCDRALVVVGDYRQLPPVVVSQDEVAQNWLGRDPFQIAGLTHDGPKPEYFVGLREQHRMHPDVSAVANALIYHGVLKDHPSTKSREEEPIDWLSPDWKHGDPLLLVDTGPLHAWVTPVSRGGGHASRLNFMSATVCADVASLLLSPDRPPLDRTGEPRVLVISPYRPHSKLVSLLLKDDGIEHEVVSGTVHSFQGSQADVVILDLVNDEPHWRVGHFMPQTDRVTERLFNVAITRAKRRLIVVGDFEYCGRLGKKAFLGGKFIPHLRERHRIVSALDVVPDGIAGRAARANRQVFGGAIKLEHERTIVRQDRFYSLLAVDLGSATTRVVVYSPFITQARLAEIEVHLKGAIERGASVAIITKPFEERQKAERAAYRTLERELARWGANVIHKKGMHEKLVLIDSSIVWTGSLNPLSFRDTQEVMERRCSPEVFEEYSKTLMLEELLAEYSAGTPTCPICGEEVAAAEGGKTPFYWVCVNDTCPFRRSIDDEALKNGEVRCQSCGGEVKLVEKDKDGRARWVCSDNARHKQLVKPMHLQFAKVRERFSATRLQRLERRFAAEAKRNGKPRPAKAGTSLFD